MSEEPDGNPTIVEVRGWIEFMSWSAVLMTPVVWWQQGPSVLTDQLCARSGLVVISLATGVAMRIWTLAEKQNPRKDSAPIHD